MSVSGGTRRTTVESKLLWDALGLLRSLRYETRNSGLFYLSATHEAQRFVATLADRVASEDIWDQSAWNQESFRLSYGARRAAGVSLRVMHYLCWMNTKVLLKWWSSTRLFRQVQALGVRPAALHVVCGDANV